MASKKGIIITVIILAVITGVSFIPLLAWIVPQDNEATFVISDYENYLDGVKKIQEVLQEPIYIEY
ncbi:MAG: hypothetical protein QQN41_03985, partial [Nitrosopumilus sp.]